MILGLGGRALADGDELRIGSALGSRKELAFILENIGTVQESLPFYDYAGTNSIRRHDERRILLARRVFDRVLFQRGPMSLEELDVLAAVTANSISNEFRTGGYSASQRWCPAAIAFLAVLYRPERPGSRESR